MLSDRDRRSRERRMFEEDFGEPIRRLTRAICLIGGIYMAGRGTFFSALNTYHEYKDISFENKKQVETEKPIEERLKSLDRKVEAVYSLMIGFTGLGGSYMLRRKDSGSQFD